MLTSDTSHSRSLLSISVSLSDITVSSRYSAIVLLDFSRLSALVNRARFATELISRYGFYVPCSGCHLYLHSVRLPLSRLIGGVPIISGERVLHDGTIKVNQISEALNAYEEISREFDTKLIMPLRNISDGNRIRELLGFEWKEGGDQLGCVLSGNYRGVKGDVLIDGGQVRRYLEEFACPVTRKIVGTYIEGGTPNHLKIAAELIGP